MPDMRTYQNEHNMLLNFPRNLLQTSKIDNNALDIDAICNLKHNLIQQTALLPNEMQNFHGLLLCPNNVNAFYFTKFHL
jgi:hypothetical protein